MDHADRHSQPRPRPAGCTLWLTGLSGAGKSTIAAALVAELSASSRLAYLLDGDVLRTGLNAGLGFGADGRAEAVRRAGEAAILLADAGVIAIVAMISPYRADRDAVRARHESQGIPFIEVFVDAPLDVVERRDPKGLYRRARAGEIPAFTGISDPYEPPVAPEVHVRTGERDAAECATRVLVHLAARTSPAGG